MIRVVLSGGDLNGFRATGCSDEYINASFVPEGAPYTVPFEPGDLDGIDADHRPRPRRYTVRAWDPEQQKLTIDFVSHGDDGFAGPWAKRARPGDRLQFKGPGGSYRPNPEAGWHLLVGDESALPAIAVTLEQLQPGARAVALIVVDDQRNEQQLTSPGNVDVVWLHRNESPNPENLLVDAVAAIEFATGPIDLFIHGEADEVRAVRRHLRVERGLDLDGASISPYWRRDHTDEAWRAIKAQWMSEQAAEL